MVKQFFNEEEDILIVNHNSGFFSCCTIRIQNIINYFNKHKKLPTKIINKQFSNYKPDSIEIENLDKEFFTEDKNILIPYTQVVKYQYRVEDQFMDYRLIDFKNINKFIKRYFNPSNKILNKIKFIENKYKLDYDNICVLFLRGTDKVTEINIPSYSEYEKISTQLSNIENLKFLIQSDETEFIEYFSDIYENNIVFKDEIITMKKTSTTNTFLNTDNMNKRFENIINYLAITYIMSKCKYVICNSGNCSLWIAYFRGNVDGLIQLNPLTN